MKLFLRTWLILFLFIAGTQSVLAVPPPDFLFSVGAQVMQIFSILAIFLSAAVVSASRFFKVYFQSIKYKKIIMVALAITIIGTSLATAYGYQQYEQNKQYREWIAQSKAQIINESTQNNSTQEVNIKPAIINRETIRDTSLYETNTSVPVAISNADFKQVISDGNVFVLDAREDEEYAIGNSPQSTHIRFADLMAGEWVKLPADRTIYVFCWSGMRGKEVTDFLRSKKILARYIDKGADGWVASGGKWTGGIKFSSKYGEDRYQKVFNLDEMKKFIEDGVVIVDSRPAAKYNKKHIAGSINIPIIYTASSKMDTVLEQVPSGKKVITVCDDFISCFDAKVTGVKLEKRGNEFLGRYNKPWEYK
jgi:rhodanese-related sulfurtransferase